MNYRAKKSRDRGTMDMFTDFTFSPTEEVNEFVKAWNSRLGLIRLIPTDRQCALIRDAIGRPFFKEHWRAALTLMGKSTFLMLKMRPRMSLDWFCEPDNFDKIIEEKYTDEKYRTQPEANHSTRNGEDEEII